MGKWIVVRPGYYKYVSNDDPRPKVKLKPKELGDTYVKFTPSWKKYEPNIHDLDPDKKEDFKITDAFLAERDHETKTDPKARRWEESRKKEWARNKPVWRKQMMREGII